MTKHYTTLRDYLTSKPHGYAKELAAKIGTHRAYLSSLANGHRPPGIGMIERIQESEGITLDYTAMRAEYRALKAAANEQLASR